MPKPTVQFTPIDNWPWVQYPKIDKIKEQILSYDPDTGNVTKIHIIEPGYNEGGDGHSHDYWEEIYILDGTAYCGTLKRWLQPGEYACRPPGMHHGPFSTKPDTYFKYLIVDTFVWAEKDGVMKAPSRDVK